MFERANWPLQESARQVSSCCVEQGVIYLGEDMAILLFNHVRSCRRDELVLQVSLWELCHAYILKPAGVIQGNFIGSTPVKSLVENSTQA